MGAGQGMVGAMLSWTVTVALALALLPLASVAVSETVFAPVFAQVKLLGLPDRLVILQWSDEPLFTSAATMVAWPLASSWIVMFLVTTVGAMLSWTVTVALALALLPLASVAVSETVFAPVFAQVKLLGLTDRLVMLQLSDEPLFTSAATMVAWPLASSWIVMFLVTTVGAMLSWTVTVALALALLPLASVAVSETVFAPVFAQVKLLGLTDRLVMLQL